LTPFGAEVDVAAHHHQPGLPILLASGPGTPAPEAIFSGRKLRRRNLPYVPNFHQSCVD
jgi:hypothetical protein